MDRTLGDTAREVKDFSDLIVLRNVPFESIPRGFIEYLRNKCFTYAQYIQTCKFYNESGAYWNLIVYDKQGKPLSVVWGTWDPLEAHFRVVRVSSHPKTFKASGRFMKWLFRQIKLYASEMQAERMYWESDQWQIWLRKLGDLVYVNDMKVVQAY